MTPSGVAGTRCGSPRNSRPAFSGWNPSTSFAAVDGSRDGRLVHVLGERKLDEDAVDVVVGIELRDDLEHLALGRVRREAMVARVDPGLVRGVVLPGDVDVRRRIVAHEDRREAHGLAEGRHLLGDLSADLLCQRLPVDERPRHGS